MTRKHSNKFIFTCNWLHEWSHFVMAKLLGIKIEKVCFYQDGAGVCPVYPEKPNRWFTARIGMVCIAPIAFFLIPSLIYAYLIFLSYVPTIEKSDMFSMVVDTLPIAIPYGVFAAAMAYIGLFPSLQDLRMAFECFVVALIPYPVRINYNDLEEDENGVDVDMMVGLSLRHILKERDKVLGFFNKKQ